MDSVKSVIVALDLSINSTGYAIMDLESKVLECGTILPFKYKNYTKDRYPKSTLKNIASDVDQLSEIIRSYSKDYNIERIIIEEINAGKGGTKTIKGLSWLHGFLMVELGYDNYRFDFVTSSGWRSDLKLKFSEEQRKFNKSLKKWDKSKITYKHLAIVKVNEIYGTEMDYEDNDVAEAICIGLSYLVKKGLTL